MTGGIAAYKSAILVRRLKDAGCLMTFILSLGYYITPALVGGPRDQMLSNFIATYINRDLNWGMAAALALLLLVMTLSIYLLFLRLVGAERIKLG